MNEIWKSIVNLDGYFVSNLGRIKSKRNNREIIKKSWLDRRGYLYSTFYHNNKFIHKKNHRIIAECFIPKVEGKLHVNHKNGIKTDNRIENLEWCTPRENSLHAYKTGLLKNIAVKGNKFSRKLTDEQVLEIRNSKIPSTFFVNKYNICKSTVSYIRNKKSWKGFS